MSVILKDEFRNARKHYKCDATELFHCAGIGPQGLNADEKLILDAADADRGKILPGQRYRYVRGIHEGRMFTFRARCGMDSICIDHELYDEQ